MEVHHRQPRRTRPHQPRLSRKGTGWCPQPKENRAARIRLRDGCPQRFGRRSRPNGVARVRRCRTSSNGAWPRPLVSSDTPSTRCPPPPPSSKGCSAERSPWPTSARMGTSASGPSTASTASSCSSKASATTSVPVARHPSPRSERTVPFAVVTWFEADTTTTIDGVGSLAALERAIDTHRPTQNVFVGIRVDGVFDMLSMRAACPAAPGENLVQATAHQSEFTVDHIEGTMVGFWASGVRTSRERPRLPLPLPLRGSNVRWPRPRRSCDFVGGISPHRIGHPPRPTEDCRVPRCGPQR